MKLSPENFEAVRERLVDARMNDTEEHEHEGLARRFYETLYDLDNAQRMLSMNSPQDETLIEDAEFLEVDISDLMEGE